MAPKTHLIFIRHGQQEPAGSENPHFSGLTELGRAEARSVGGKLDLKHAETKVLSVDNARSLATVALALYPKINDEEINDKILQLKESRQLITTSKLSYLPVEDKEFEKQLANSFSQSTALRFLVDHSDAHRLTDNARMSSYSTLAYEAANAIEYFYKKAQKDVLVELETSENDLYRVFCGREFVYACFRAKLLENTHGVGARDEYVDWYGEFVEWSHEAREDIAITTIQDTEDDDSKFLLRDSYGQVVFGVSEIKTIIIDYQDRFPLAEYEGETT